jgi:VWFA-related protein
MARLMWRNYILVGLILMPAAFAVDSQQSSSASPSPEPAPQATPASQSSKRTVYETATVLKTTTRLVVVDVVATDHKDDAVADLKRDDFTILEDGKPQRIAAFTFQQPADLMAKSSDKPNEAPKLPENIFTNVPRYNSTSALNVVLLDALNTTAPHQAYARQQMIKFLEKMPEGRPVAIYTLGSKLTLLQDFTSDPAALKEVMKKVKGGISPLLDNPAGGEDSQILPTGAVDSGLVSQDALQAIMRFEQERVSFQTDLRVTYTLNALNAIGRSLAGYPGRKNLVWISEAFPFSIDPNSELTTDTFAGTRNYAAQLASTADLLIDAQVAMYPVDARALEGYSVFSAANSGTDKFGRSMGRNPTRMTNSMSAEAQAWQAAHATMQDVAQRTGGKAFYNRNDLDVAIRKSIEDGSTYYTLAYYPENKNWNGKFRKISVKVDRPGVKLRYRLGYYAVDPTALAENNRKQQMLEFAEALSLDSPSATGLRFWAGVVPPSEKTPDLQVNFLVDANAISFERLEDGKQHADVDCVVQAYNKGRLIKTEASTSKSFLSPANFEKTKQQGYPCQRAIGLPPGSYFLRLGVRDNRTGLIGTTTARATVLPPAGAIVSPEKTPGAATKVEDKKP